MRGVLLLSSAVLLLVMFNFGCSKPIDSKLAGIYFDASGSGQFDLLETGRCYVTEPSRGSGRVLTGNCEVIGNNLLRMKMDTEYAEGFGYPEFREASATLKIEGNTLITQNGTRFVWKYKIPD